MSREKWHLLTSLTRRKVPDECEKLFGYLRSKLLQRMLDLRWQVGKIVGGSLGSSLPSARAYSQINRK